MTTIPGVSITSFYGYTAPAPSAGSSANSTNNAPGSVPGNQLSLESTLVSLSNGASSPLTYNAAGLISALQPTTPSSVANATSGVQAAQDAVLAAENLITQTLSALTSGTTSNSSSSDISSLFALTGTTATNYIYGSTLDSLLNPTNNNASTNIPGAQSAQDAILNAQYALNQALASLAANSTSNSNI
jgi:hypothetical protein